MATPLQRGPSTLFARLSTARTRGHYATNQPTCSATLAATLTLHLEPLLGAGHLTEALVYLDPAGLDRMSGT